LNRAVYKFKGKFNYARLKGRRPLQNQLQRQLRPAKAGRYIVKSNGPEPAARLPAGGQAGATDVKRWR
jgi:hypothetical protein